MLTRFRVRIAHRFPMIISRKVLSSRNFASHVPLSTASEVQQRVQYFFDEKLAPLNEKIKGPLPSKNSDTMTPLPFVFVLGNHSSGKSSFINYVLKKNVQKAGVAPTDDGFTIIAPGRVDADQDGPALIGDPDFGFSGLRLFGQGLMNHVNLKVRSGLDVSDLMLIDSPGMIDSPGSTGQFLASSLVGNEKSHDRGYDFHRVTKWFAERADVILLFFDPDKPGTTGETLSIMTNALAGMDHKLHIILNKVDQFDNVHDFARSYGALCWNLSKVIHRKDLPRIYTMCLPTETHVKHTGHADLILQDLKRSREEVVKEVLKAPSRRIDNMITRLYDACRVLKIYAVTSAEVKRDYRKIVMTRWATLFGLGLLGPSLACVSVAVGAPPSMAIYLSLASLPAAGGYHLFSAKKLESKIEYLLSDDGLLEVFEKVHASEIAEGDEFVTSLWERVRPQIQTTVESNGFNRLQYATKSDIDGINAIINEEVPRLRRLTAALSKVA